MSVTGAGPGPRIRKWIAAAAGIWAAMAAGGAELVLDFSRMTPGSALTNFQAALTGGGPPPKWELISVETASQLPPLSGGEEEMARETVLAQLSTDPTDERFPLLIYTPEVFSDFSATLRFRTVSGRLEQMAGLAFRLQDETNYYVLRASSLGNSFRFYKFVNGTRSAPIGPTIPIPSGRWHTLEVRCKGNVIQCLLNGKEVMPPLNDTSFSKGRVALWTKSDSVSHFSSLRVVYDVVRTLPEQLVRSAMERYPRLYEVTVYARDGDKLLAAASSDPAKVGAEATYAEHQALREGVVSAGATRDHSVAVFPLRDRNGEPLFALRLKMRTFRGQTDNNVAARGRIIADYLQQAVQTADAMGAQ